MEGETQYNLIYDSFKYISILCADFFKVYKNCFQHLDILEEKKANSFSVGRRLIIQGEEFEDLDEILARYIAPMASFVKEIISHKNFRSEEQLEAQSSQTQEQTQVNSDFLTFRNFKIK